MTNSIFLEWPRSYSVIETMGGSKVWYSISLACLRLDGVNQPVLYIAHLFNPGKGDSEVFMIGFLPFPTFAEAEPVAKYLREGTAFGGYHFQVHNGEWKHWTISVSDDGAISTHDTESPSQYPPIIPHWKKSNTSVQTISLIYELDRPLGSAIPEDRWQQLIELANSAEEAASPSLQYMAARTESQPELPLDPVAVQWSSSEVLDNQSQEQQSQDHVSRNGPRGDDFEA
jgi:hypothetical protein